MTITDKTASGQTDTITFDVVLGHRPEKVWRALTDQSLLAEWLLPATGFSPTPGTAFVLKTQPYPGWDGTVNCRVLESDPPKKLSYTWVVGGMELDTVVTFTLAESGAGTHLTITQSGFAPSQKQNFGGARYGWTMMGKKLLELLDRSA